MNEDIIATKVDQGSNKKVWIIQTKDGVELTLPIHLTKEEVMSIVESLKEIELHGFNRGLVQNVETIKELEDKVRELRRVNNELSKVLLKYQEDIDVLD